MADVVAAAAASVAAAALEVAHRTRITVSF